MTSTPAVKLTGLTKRFGKRTVVNNINLVVPSGGFYGIVGPNGAGKSTTLSMIAGLLKPDSGHISVAGFDVVKDREHVLESIGIMMEGLSLPERLTGAELLTYTARLRGMEDGWQQRATDLLEVLGLDKIPSTLIIDYSTGMRKKIGLAVAILHVPKVLVLDEPFEAIDPVSARAIMELLKQYVAGGGTVLLSSHIMDVVEAYCERVVLIKDGTVVIEGAVSDITSDSSLDDVFIKVVGKTQERNLDWLTS
ncbi:ABC transporter ATP-binding protein [bacterium]|nr:MAG: ABC transporter ATP-binding protein [bacterium]